jgi:hypothetical protein
MTSLRMELIEARRVVAVADLADFHRRCQRLARLAAEGVQLPWAMCCQAVLAATMLAVQGSAAIALPTVQIKPISSFFLTVAGSERRKSANDGVAPTVVKVAYSEANQ